MQKSETGSRPPHSPLTAAYVELANEGHGSADVQQKIRTFTVLADYLHRVV